MRVVRLVGQGKDQRRLLLDTPGSFGSRTNDGIDGALSVLGEVLETFDGFEAKASDHRQRGVSQRGEHLGSMAGIGPGLILSACDVANVV
jgi:hypothetical protein